jgi:hypothetical protein
VAGLVKVQFNPGNPWPHITRVARWFLFKPKIPIWVNFGGP